jgi:hypothetical protein
VTTEPQLWKLLYNPPGASPYTGAATYQYPIALPPGVGGLTPDLTLVYSSRTADEMRQPAMSSGFGAGWSLPQAKIHNGNAGHMYLPHCPISGCETYNSYSFTLVLGGVTYYLDPVQAPAPRYHGRYRAIGGPELQIEYLTNTMLENVSKEYWRIRTADGATYLFGESPDSEQVIGEVSTFHNSAQPANDRFAPVNWMLQQVQDVHSNVIYYNYKSACGLKPDGSKREWTLDGSSVKQCTEVDIALSQISYNATKTTVTFDHNYMNGRLLKEDSYMLVGHYQPSKITVAHDGQTISTETFNYELGFHYRPEKAYSSQFWLLTGITHSGSSGATLPAHTFVYEQPVTDGCSQDVDGTTYCVDALTRVNNGYGAVTQIAYSKIEKWLVVAQISTWDGVVYKNNTTVAAQQITYDHSGYGYCKDTATARCHTGGEATATGTLVGFDGVRTLLKTGTGQVLSKTVTRFYNDDDDNPLGGSDPDLIDDYWRIGKVKSQEHHIPGSGTNHTAKQG